MAAHMLSEAPHNPLYHKSSVWRKAVLRPCLGLAFILVVPGWLGTWLARNLVG